MKRLVVLAVALAAATSAAALTVDLTTASGLAAVGGEWRVREASIVPAAFFAAGADGQPGEAPSSTFDVEPKAGWSDFDDSEWPVVPGGELSKRLGGGKLSFAWYRLKLTLPESILEVPVAGRAIELETVVDDAAEVWVDGELRRCPGQAGGAMVAGWGAPNRVVLTRAARPGQTIRVAIFGINGPLSGSPTNYVWMKSARLLLGAAASPPLARAVSPACEENVAVERSDPRAEAIFSLNPKLYLVAEGLASVEELVWDPANGGSLVLSDPEESRIHRWSEAGGLSVAPERSGAPAGSAIDGTELDREGNRFRASPVGLRVEAPDGTLLALVRTPRPVHDLAWGEDGSVLYLAAREQIYRLPTKTRGHAPHLAPTPRVVRVERAFDRLVRPGAAPELVALGHHWLEGPAWDAARGELVYSDIPKNAIFALKPGERPRRLVERSGYSGSAPFTGREPGSNGLVFDREGRLVVCQHGDRRVVRREPDGTTTVLADRFDGRRLNSPNDAIVTPAGEVWFTDPPFGLPGAFDDPGKELPFQGVYRIDERGVVHLLTDAVRAPNGLALAPDGGTLYVSNAEPGVDATVYAFDVVRDAAGEVALERQRTFVDLTRESKAGAPGAPDGLEVDRDGNVWLAGPGGVRVYTRAAKLLGRIDFDRPAANLEFGGDGFLYVTADTAIWRVKLADGSS